MPSAPVFNMQGAQQGSLDLSDQVFGVEENTQVVKEAVVALQANARQGNHMIKGRHLVSGSGAKPFRQKGTGRARQGTNRAPQMRGGGIVHGPLPRSYRQALTPRQRRQALCSALSSRVAGERLSVVRDLSVSEAKTKPLAAMVQVLAPRTKEDKGMPHKTLLVINGIDDNLVLSIRNLPSVMVRTATDVNVLDILQAGRVLVQEEAVKTLEERLG